MVVVNFYHPDSKRHLAKIRAIDEQEAVSRFKTSYNKGYLVNPKFIGRTPEEELQYLYFDWDALKEGLPNDEFCYEKELTPETVH